METEFNLEKVKKLVEHTPILKNAYERTTRRSNRGDASYLAIWNALICKDKGFLEKYAQIV